MKSRYGIYLIAILSCCTSSLFGVNDNFGLLLDATRKNYDQGNYNDAYDSLTKAGLQLFEKMPLALANCKLVEQPAEGFGIYTARESNVYKADEPIYIYCEPRGYSFKKNGDEYQFGLVTDFSVTDTEGHVLGGQNDFGNFEFVSHHPSMEFLLNLTYSLSGVEPGVYKLHTTAKDSNSGKQTTETIEIRIEK